MEFLRVLITAPVSLITILLLSKLIGNKQISSLNIFDYTNGITIGSIAAEMATTDFNQFWICLIALIIYASVVIAFTLISQKSVIMRRFLTGKAIILYDKGKLYKKNLFTAKVDVNEFLTLCRCKGFFNLDDIETVVLEQNGQVSILPKDTKRPVTPNDLKLRVNQSRAEVVVILDGNIMIKNLKYTGNNKEWLNNELTRNKTKLSDVFMAVCDNNNLLKIYNNSNLNPTNDLFS